MDWAKTSARPDENRLSFRIWCALYYRSFGIYSFDGYSGRHCMSALIICLSIGYRTAWQRIIDYWSSQSIWHATHCKPLLAGSLRFIVACDAYVRRDGFLALGYCLRFVFSTAKCIPVCIWFSKCRQHPIVGMGQLLAKRCPRLTHLHHHRPPPPPPPHHPTPGQNDRHFTEDFSNAFLWTLNFVFRFEFHWILFPRVQLPISQHWFR